MKNNNLIFLLIIILLSFYLKKKERYTQPWTGNEITQCNNSRAQDDDGVFHNCSGCLGLSSNDNYWSDCLSKCKCNTCPPDSCNSTGCIKARREWLECGGSKDNWSQDTNKWTGNEITQCSKSEAQDDDGVSHNCNVCLGLSRNDDNFMDCISKCKCNACPPDSCNSAGCIKARREWLECGGSEGNWR